MEEVQFFSASQANKEICACGYVLEFVITENKGVKSDDVHPDGVHLWSEKGVKEGAGDGVSGVDLHHGAIGLLFEVIEETNCPGEATVVHADIFRLDGQIVGDQGRINNVERKFLEMRVVIVNVQERDVRLGRDRVGSTQKGGKDQGKDHHRFYVNINSRLLLLLPPDVGFWTFECVEINAILLFLRIALLDPCFLTSMFRSLRLITV